MVEKNPTLGSIETSDYTVSHKDLSLTLGSIINDFFINFNNIANIDVGFEIIEISLQNDFCFSKKVSSKNTFASFPMDFSQSHSSQFSLG